MSASPTIGAWLARSAMFSSGLAGAGRGDAAQDAPLMMVAAARPRRHDRRRGGRRQLS
jgi:hypothetical protein